jgi:hypothetical protein
VTPTRDGVVICPFCIRPRVLGRDIEATFEVGEGPFPLPHLGPRLAKVYWCRGADGCQSKIPVSYVDEYRTHPPLFCPLGGLGDHGKTVYLFSLLDELSRSAAALPVGEGIDEVIRWMRAWREDGRLPGKTQLAPTHSCTFLRVTGFPGMPQFHLVLQDAAGELAEGEITIRNNGLYLTDAPLIVLFVSLADLAADGRVFSETLTRYVEAITTLSRVGQSQSLLVVLSKADQLLSDSALPDEARRVLLTEPDELYRKGIAGDRSRRETLSRALEGWLVGHPRFGRAVDVARQHFIEVRYCLVSATDGPVEIRDNDRYLAPGAQPRGVLDPLSWMVDLQTDRPLRLRLTAELEACRRRAPRHQRQDLDDAERMLTEGRYQLAEGILRRACPRRHRLLTRGLAALAAVLVAAGLLGLRCVGGLGG